MPNPLVSVLIPCYNVENYVEESLQSIINQTYSNLEIIVIDDCSTDDTPAILARLAESDARIKIHRNESNLKLIKTLNKGVSLCSGEYIARMDADDISLPTRIEKQVDFLTTHNDYDIVSTQFYTFRSGSDKKNLYHNPVRFEDLQAYLLFKSGICHPAVMIRKRVFVELGLKFEEKYLYVEDYALWSKALYCTRLANLEEALLLYRVHEHQVSTLNEEKQIDNKKEVFKTHCNALNLDQSEEALNIYASVADCVPAQSSIIYLHQCEKFMISLLEKNKKMPFCDSNYLEKMLSLHWIRLCANSQLGLNVLKMCKSSKLYRKENYSTRDLLILIVKCIFKLEYKKSIVYKFIFR